MTGILRAVAGSVLLASALWTTGAVAQSIGPDEAVASPGSVAQRSILTPQQRRAIYEAVGRQRLRSSELAIAAVVGAPVPPSLLLQDLPDQATGDPDAAADDSNVRLLKYAMVADDVVVIDPIAMRVVDVIHRNGVKP